MTEQGHDPYRGTAADPPPADGPGAVADAATSTQAWPPADPLAPPDPYARPQTPADGWSQTWGADPYATSWGTGGYPATPASGYAASGTAPTSAPPARGLGVVVLVAAVTALVVGLVAGLGGYLMGRAVDRPAARAGTVSLPQAPGDTSPRSGDSIAGIVESVMPAVVSLRVENGTLGGTGSGFVVRPDGYIVTNNHVVSAAADGGDIEVFFADGSSSAGEIVGRNASSDLAVVKVEQSDLPTVVLGDSEAVTVGDLAIAIGAPLGLEGTVTSGIVSALNRPVTAGGAGGDDKSFINAIQTDAAINPGNSGGPLLNAAGQVIGVNSAIATLATGGEGGSIGLGFAIPVNTAKRIAEEIIETGTSSTPIIGVQLDLTYTGPGATVSEVTRGGPAEDAGLRAGDVITAVDGRQVADAEELVVAIRANAPGDEITLTVQRGGAERDVAVVLGADTSS